MLPHSLKHLTPVFVTGCQRSGTTLMGNLLGAHRNALLLDETDGIYTWVEHLIESTPDATAPDLDELFSELCQRARNHYQHPDTRADSDGRLDPSITHIIFKAPNLAYSAHDLARHWPQARVVFLIRDVRDVVLSMGELPDVPMVANQLRRMRQQKNAEGRFQPELGRLASGAANPDIARALVWQVKTRMRHEFSETGLPLHLVDYEALVHDPDTQTRSALAFCGLDPVGQPSEHSSVLTGQGPGKNDRSQPVHEQSIARWRKGLKPEQEQMVWATAGEAMHQLGRTRFGACLPQHSWDHLPEPARERPIIATGRGGSGTRLMSELLQCLGLFLGNELNRSGDSIEWVHAIYNLAVARLEGEAGPPEDQVRQAIRQNAAAILHRSDWRPEQPWGWKLPESMLMLPQLCNSFEDARVIHMIRHPVDTCLRRTHMTSRTNNMIGKAALGAAYAALGRPHTQIERDEPHIHNAISWAYQVGPVACYGREVLGPTRYLEISYESICATPEVALDALACFLGIDHTGRHYRLEIDPSRQRKWSPPDPRAQEVWDLCGDIAMELGYEPIEGMNG